MMRQLANAQYLTGLASGNTGWFFSHLAGRSALTGLAIGHWIGCIHAIQSNFF